MLELPSSNDAKIEILTQLRQLSEDAVRPLHVQWALNHHWMQGARHFRVNYTDGTVVASYLQANEGGEPRLRVEDLVPKVQAEIGRLLRMDVRPSTKYKGFGLDAVRKASAAKVILEYLTAHVNFDKLKLMTAYHLVLYGACGLGLWVRPSSVGAAPEALESGMAFQGPAPAGPPGLPRITIEVIPIWQLYPIPANPLTPESVDGFFRKRWVTLDWLKRRAGLSLPKDISKLEPVRAPYGQPPTLNPISEEMASTGLESFGGGSGKSSKRSKLETEYVLLEEYFGLHEDRDRLQRWTVKIGSHIARDDVYEDLSVYCPIGIPRYYPLGGFYGRSFVEILQPINAEQEAMAARLFQVVKDLDAYGTTLIPSTWGLSKRELLDSRRRNKVCFYEPEVGTERSVVQQIQPVNLGDFPGKVAAMASQMLDRLAVQSELLRGGAPGRVDSAAGLSFLHETSSVPLTVPALAIADGFAQVYKELLAAAPELLEGTPALPISGLDDSILGLIVDPDTGTVTLDPRNYPAPFEVSVDIRDKLPVPPMLREQKLNQSLQMGLITPIQYRFIVWKEGLDIPVGNWAEMESFRKATLQVLTLFGDGQKPGQVVSSAEADNAEVHLMVIQAFMAKVEFQFASIEVREAFENLKKTYMGFLGKGIPEQFPGPIESAEMAAVAQQGGSAGPGSQMIPQMMPTR